MRKSATFLMLALTTSSCLETRNKVSRSVQNMTGVEGVVDVLAGDKVLHRFLEVKKLTTALATHGNDTRDYRYGWGIYDKNQNFKVDEGEKKVYFEVSNYSTMYVFYENPFK